MEEFVAAELPVMAILSYPQPFVGTENSISFFPHNGGAGEVAISAIRYRFRRSARLSRWLNGDAKTSEVAGLRSSCLPVTTLLFLTGLDYPYYCDRSLCGTLHAIEDVTESDLLMIREYETSLLSQYLLLQQDPDEIRAGTATAGAVGAGAAAAVAKLCCVSVPASHMETLDNESELLLGTDLLGDDFHLVPLLSAEMYGKPARRRDSVELVGRWACDVCESLVLIDHSECIKCALKRSRLDLGIDELQNGRKNNSPLLSQELDLEPDSASNNSSIPFGGNIDPDRLSGPTEGPQTPDSIIPGQPDFHEFVNLSGKGNDL